MLDFKELLLYKETYHGHKLIYVRFSNEEFIFRTLSKKEYKHVLDFAETKYDKEDMVCNLSCIYPEGYAFDDCPYAGLPNFVSGIIEEQSGFFHIETIFNELETARNGILTFEKQAVSLIKAFLPEYRLEEIEDWTWQELMEKVALAEQIAIFKGFDWKLQLKTEEELSAEQEEAEKRNKDNKEFVAELINAGIDPMFYFKDSFHFTKNILDWPFTGGRHWQNGEIMDAIRDQIHRKSGL